MRHLDACGRVIYVPDVQRVLPSAEGAARFFGGPSQVLDRPRRSTKNVGGGDACCAAGIATVLNYDGAAPAAELHKFGPLAGGSIHLRVVAQSTNLPD